MLRPALLEHGCKCAGKVGVLRAAGGQVALEVRQVGSRFNMPAGYGVPPGYYLWARLLASPTPLPTTVGAYRILQDYVVAGPRQLGTYFTGPFERLAAAGFGPPEGARFDMDALNDLAALARLMARAPDAAKAASWTSLPDDLLSVNEIGKAALIGALRNA